MCVDACLPLSCLTGGFLWTKYRDRWCNPGNTYKNVEEAQAACVSSGPNCQGVYDDGCDGRGAAFVCKTGSVAAPDSGGCVVKPAAEPSTTFKPTTWGTLKTAVGTLLQATPTGKFDCDPATSDAPPPSSVNFDILRGSIGFERLDESEPTVNFDDLYGSIVYAVRRMG